MSTVPLLKAVKNKEGVIASVKADALISTYQEFKDVYIRMVDSITANIGAESEGTPRNVTTQQIIANAKLLSLISSRLSKAIAEYVPYMEKEGLGTPKQIELLKSYRSKFQVYSTKLSTLVRKAEEFQKTGRTNAYRYSKKNRGATYNNYRENAIALKWKTANVNEARNVSIVLNEFTALLKEIMPARYAARMTPVENVTGVGSLFAESEGGRRSTRKTLRRSKTHRRRTVKK